MVSRRQLLQIGSTAAVMPAARKRPNLLFLFTDDQRFDTIRALGNSEVHTPNMDRLVKRGTAFTHAFIMGGSVPAVCMPSRAMLMTGQSLWHVHESIVAPSLRGKPFHLFPQEFGKAGYKTFGIGKWHNGPALFNQAFADGDNVFSVACRTKPRFRLTAMMPQARIPRNESVGSFPANCLRIPQ
ncbi:MAG: sulfatase-like hydrolase/transferase [Bryobacteraceae bacterium]